MKMPPIKHNLVHKHIKTKLEVHLYFWETFV